MESGRSVCVCRVCLKYCREIERDSERKQVGERSRCESTDILIWKKSEPLMNNSCSINGRKATWKPFNVEQSLYNEFYGSLCCKYPCQTPSSEVFKFSRPQKTRIKKNTLRDSILLHMWFWQLFTLQHRAEGLNLLTHPKSNLDTFFFGCAGRFASKYWLWHCCFCTASQMKTVNEHHPFRWQRKAPLWIYADIRCECDA